MIYDLFYVSEGEIQQDDWQLFKSRFPNAQKIENVKSFKDIKSKAFTKMFWVVWDDLVVREDFDFSYRSTQWDTQYVHVFKNGNHFNGVSLFPKSTVLSDKEFKFRFYINKKEIDTVASDPKKQGSSFDIVFISYQEPNADKNWQALKSRFPRAKRVSDIRGIHRAHIEAAKLADSEMFWVVDGDAEILDDFNFDYDDPEKHTVHVWRSRNPINDLEYGYGGVKLLPTQMTIDMDMSKPDMTTSISNQFKPVDQVSNITAFNTDPFNTWKSAFRECVKLASKIIDRQDDMDTEQRLNAWCTEGLEKPYGGDAIRGANEGKYYGIKNRDDIAALKLINNFDWLREQFDGR